MKNLLRMFVALIVLFAVACKKDNAEKPVCCVIPDLAYIKAQKSGVAWQARPEYFKTQTDSVTIIGRQENELVLIRIKFTGKGSYAITPAQASLTYLIGGDGIVAEYYADDAATNTLEVTDYNAEKNNIKGNFNVTFKKSARYTDATFAQTVKFSQGSFSVFIP
ncbi:hypothetical protein FPZ43_18595 [Mucilaginibacter pallidiroseus]|uniref:Lipoprotein n=1 Tax=Mucilaginibacter pallidiroseus TaxID=2599295 RepID=A0A563TXC5_9SPHI|nr:DUF6252 family protein [Mucilaginibacter pallidiroseus]TWR24018.1 hypothetical protein FPZ43_18595 [Mucilaginibacter pallidiroseus]